MALKIFDVIKWEGSVGTLVWKHPGEDFSTHSTLIVDESQVAILYKNGQAADVFTAGRYVLHTRNIPVLRKLLEIPTGGVSTFNCKVYFVNLVEAMKLRWGLDSKVSYMEPTYQIPISIGARGEMSVQVGDPAHFIVNLVGTERELTAETLTSYFRSMIVMRVKSYLTRTILDRKINIFTIDGELDVLAAALKERLAPELEAYGVGLRQFTVEAILKPEDDPLYIRVKRALAERSTGVFEAETNKQKARIAALSQADTEVIGAQGHRAALDALGTTYQQERQLDISETMAQNPGMNQFSGLAGSVAIMGGAVAMGKQMAGFVNQACDNAAQPQAAGNGAPAGTKTKKCAKCGAELPFAARFCFECGEAQPKLCPNCGAELPEKARFCLECGTKL